MIINPFPKGCSPKNFSKYSLIHQLQQSENTQSIVCCTTREHVILENKTYWDCQTYGGWRGSVCCCAKTFDTFSTIKTLLQKILISIQSVFWFLLADLFSIWRALVRVNWTWWLSKVPNIKHFEPIEAHLNHLHLIHVFEICTFVSLVVERKGVGRNTIPRAVRGNAIPDDKSNPIQFRYMS